MKDDYGLYYIDGENATLIAGTNNEEIEVVKEISTTEKTVTVTKIRQGAFCGLNNITSVVVLDSVTEIGAGAFSGCSSIETLTIPFVGHNSGINTGSGIGTAETSIGYIFGWTDEKASDSQTHQCYNYVNGKFVGRYYNIPSSLKKITVTGNTVNGEKIYYGAFEHLANWKK